MIRRADEAKPNQARLSGPAVDGRTAVIVKDMAQSGAAITQAARVLREAGAAVTHTAVAINWNPALPDVLAPVGIAPICALDLADFQALRDCGSDQATEPAQPSASQ